LYVASTVFRGIQNWLNCCGNVTERSGQVAINSTDIDLVWHRGAP